MLYEKIENKIVNEAVYFKKINDLDTYIIPKKGFSKFFAMITVKYGSNDIKFYDNGTIKEYPLGIAHFLEHKLFEEQEGNIFQKFSSLGSSPNAYTNFKVTSYYFTGTNEFNENLKLLLKFVFNPYFTEENVDKEKGIIEQEIVMYQDEPNFKVYFNALEAMYKNHPVKNDIAGTVESIRSITQDMLYDCYNRFYVPSNMFLTIVGDIEPDKVTEIVESIVPVKENISNTKKFINEDEKGINHSEKIEKMGISIPYFVIGYKDENIHHRGENILRKKLICDIITCTAFGRSSDCYEKLYSLGLIDETFDSDYTAEEDYAHYVFAGESSEPEKVREILKEDIEKLKHNGIKENEFERAKKVITGSFIGSFNSVDRLGNIFGYYNSKNINLFNYIDTLKQIDLDEVNEELKSLFDEENCVISIVK